MHGPRQVLKADGKKVVQQAPPVYFPEVSPKAMPRDRLKARLGSEAGAPDGVTGRGGNFARRVTTMRAPVAARQTRLNPGRAVGPEAYPSDEVIDRRGVQIFDETRSTPKGVDQFLGVHEAADFWVPRARASGAGHDVAVIGKDAEVDLFQGVVKSLEGEGAKVTSIKPMVHSQGIYGWNTTANAAWLDGVAQSGAPVVLTHPLSRQYMVDAVTNQPTMYAREVAWLKQRGYVLDPDYTGPGVGRLVPGPLPKKPAVVDAMPTPTPDTSAAAGPPGSRPAIPPRPVSLRPSEDATEEE
jgi:hypothetical protein